jgi:hypothetical protein
MMHTFHLMPLGEIIVMKLLQKAVLFFFLSAVVASASSDKINWADLVDQSVQTFEDPYRDLTYDQLSALREVVQARERLEATGLPPETRAEIETRLTETEAALESDGIEVDWILEQRWVVAEKRERAFTAGNPEVDGKTIRLSGFAIPAPADPDGTPVAYLVPERGMCSHTPPPNPNQMVRVRLKDNWQPKYMHEPVHLTGRMSISPSEQTMMVVDGPVQMRATFSLEVDIVETVKSYGMNQPRNTSNVWVKKLVEKTRQSTNDGDVTDPAAQTD